MSVQDYVNSSKGQKRIMSIARQMNRSHRISMKQCLELARQDVEDWFKAFSPENILVGV